MPPVGAAIGIGVTWLFAGGVIANAVLNITVGLALTALSRAIASKDKPEKAKYPGLTIDFTFGEGVPLTFVFGRAAVRGHLLGPEYSDDLNEGGLPDRWLFRPTILSDIPITSIVCAYIDGQRIDFVGEAVTAGPYAGKMYLHKNLGPNTATIPIMLQWFATYPGRPWTADMIGRNSAWIAPRYKAQKENSPFKSDPYPIYEVLGAKLLNPRTSTTGFTENPIQMIWHILRGITVAGLGVYGMAVEAADLPATMWNAEMNVCDELVDGQPRYRAGMEFGLNQEPMAIIGELLKSCGGNIACCGGEWLIRAGPPTASIYSFTDDQVLTTFGRLFDVYPGLDVIHNTVTATYLDPRNAWNTTAAVSYSEPQWITEDDGRELMVELDYPAVSSPEQVRRLIREVAKDNRRFRTHEITLPPSAMHVMPLHNVDWTSARNFYDDKLFEVVAKTFDPISLVSRCVIRERDPSDYSPNITSDNDLPSPPSRLEPDYTIYGVEGLAFAGSSIKDASGTDRRPSVHSVWTQRDVDGIEIEIALALTMQVAVSAQFGAGVVSTGGTDISEGILPAQAYRGRGRVIAAGRNSTWTNWSATFNTPGTYIKEVDMAAEFTKKVNDAFLLADEAVKDANTALESITDIEGQTFLTTMVDSNGRTGVAVVKGDGTPLGAFLISSPNVFAPGLFGASKILVSNFAGNEVPDAKMVDPDAWHIYGGPRSEWTFNPSWSPFFTSQNVWVYNGPISGADRYVQSLVFPVAPGETYDITMGVATNGSSILVFPQIIFLDHNGVYNGQLGWNGIETFNGAKNFVISNVVVPAGHHQAYVRWGYRPVGSSGRPFFASPRAQKKYTGAVLITPQGITANEVLSRTLTSLQINTVEFNAAGLAVFGGSLQSQSWPTSGFRLLQNGNASFAGTVQGSEFITTDGLRVGAVSGVIFYVGPEQSSSFDATWYVSGQAGGTINFLTQIEESPNDFPLERVRVWINNVLHYDEYHGGLNFRLRHLLARAAGAITGTNSVRLLIEYSGDGTLAVVFAQILSLKR